LSFFCLVEFLQAPLLFLAQLGQVEMTFINRARVLAVFVFALTLGGLSNQTLQARGVNLDRRLMAHAENMTGDRFRYSAETPRGASVVSVSKVSSTTLTAIDRGLTDLFAIAARHGYRARLNYSDYTIFIARSDRTTDSRGAYSPDIALPAAQYAGSVYDKGGYVYAAGLVLAFQPSALVIAEHDKNFERLANVVRYEGEHLVLYHNDRALYQKTADHSRGGGHPILQ
jgi:hypothetical protein